MFREDIILRNNRTLLLNDWSKELDASLIASGWSEAERAKMQIVYERHRAQGIEEVTSIIIEKTKNLTTHALRREYDKYELAGLSHRIKRSNK